jgi:hypothetical protein
MPEDFSPHLSSEPEWVKQIECVEKAKTHSFRYHNGSGTVNASEFRMEASMASLSNEESESS